MIVWQTLIARIRETNTEILRLAPFRDFGLVPNPGATESAILLAEERLGLRLPPSYRSFLKAHDGWPRFFEGASLLSTACLGNRLYDEFARAAFSAAETPEPGLGPYLTKRESPRIIPFGADLQSTTLFAFNPQVVNAAGEYEVVAWINELGMRADDFPSFLQLLLELSECELEDQRGASDLFRRTA